MTNIEKSFYCLGQASKTCFNQNLSDFWYTV